MSYDKEQRKRELEQNNPRHLNENEQQHNPLTSDASEIDASKDKKMEQQENDRQFIDREELKHNNNTIGNDSLNNPDVMETENPSIFDLHDDMKTVDPLPVEELNEEVKDERNKDHTKDSSSSAKKSDTDRPKEDNEW